MGLGHEVVGRGGSEHQKGTQTAANLHEEGRASGPAQVHTAHRDLSGQAQAGTPAHAIRNDAQLV
jgi:hypothetical protein